MNNKAFQWLLSVETHRRKCMKIRNTCFGGKSISMMDGVFCLCGFSCVWVYIFLGRLGFFFEEFLGIGIFGVGGEGVVFA